MDNPLTKSARLLVLLVLAAGVLRPQPVPTQVQTFPDQYVRQDPGRCVEGQTLYNLTEHASKRCDSTGTWVAGGGGGSGTINSGMAGQLGRYAADGTTISGTNNLSFPAAVTPPTAPTVALAGAGAGNVDNGPHDYWVTFVTASGETDPSPLATVAVTDKTVNGKVSVTNISLGPAGTTARKLYRNPSFGPLVARLGSLLTTVSDNVTTSYTDNTADSGLGVAMLPINVTAGTSFINGVWVTNLTNFTGDNFAISGAGAALNIQNGVMLVNPIASAFAGAMAGYLQGGDSTNGLYLELRPNLSTGLLFNTVTNGSAAVNPSSPATYFTYMYDGSDNWDNKVGAPLFAVDVDFAAAGGEPFIFAIYNGADLAKFSGGFSTAGGFACVNCLASPTGVFRVNNLVYPARPVLEIQAAPSQSVDLARFYGSDGTTILSRFEKDGIIRAAGYKSSDGTTGVTVSACTLFKEGLCVAGT